MFRVLWLMNLIFKKHPKYLKSSSAALSLNNERYLEYKDYVLINGVPSQSFNASEVVDLGYGIESSNYSDYEGLNIKDKVVLSRLENLLIKMVIT